MKGKEVAILFFMIVVLSFYIFSEKGEETHYELPEVLQLQAEDITKIAIKQADSEIILDKKEGKWLVVPGEYPADPGKVDKIITLISGIKLTALASEKKNYAMYELDDETRVEVAAFAGDDMLRRLSIGKTASSYKHTFVMLDGDDRVFHSTGDFRGDFDRTGSDFRDKTVMAIKEDISEILLTKGKEEIKITRQHAPVSLDAAGRKEEELSAGGDGPAWIASDGTAGRADAIQEIINTLSSLQCDEFIDDRSRSDFKSPVYSVTLKGISNYSIYFYDEKDGRYPAVASTSEYPFVISDWKVKKIMREFKDILKQKQ